MEETGILFDGDDKREDLAHMGGEAATTHLSRAIVLQDRTRSTNEDVVPDTSESERSEKRRHSLAESAMTSESSMNWLKRSQFL